MNEQRIYTFLLFESMLNTTNFVLSLCYIFFFIYLAFQFPFLPNKWKLSKRTKLMVCTQSRHEKILLTTINFYFTVWAGASWGSVLQMKSFISIQWNCCESALLHWMVFNCKYLNEFTLCSQQFLFSSKKLIVNLLTKIFYN